MRALFLILALTGCALFSPPGTIPVSQSLSVPAQAAQSAINEANAILIAFNNTVGQQKVDGVITAAERDAYLDKSDAYGEQLDRAQKSLRTGDVVTAKNQAELVKTLVTTLHKAVAAKARQ